MQELISEIKNAASIGIWEWRLRSGLVLWSNDLYKILDLQPGEITISKDTLFDLVIPEERDNVREGLEKLHKEHKSIALRLSVYTPKLSHKVLFGQFKAVKDNQGNVESIRGVIQDVTHIEIIENKLIRFNEQINHVTKQLEKEKASKERLQKRLEKAKVKIHTLQNRQEARLKKRIEVLLESNQDLKRLNSDLENFMFSASHDLRSPIFNLEGLMRILFNDLEGQIGESEKGLIRMISTSIEKFKKTILDLTEITKVQKGTIEDIDVVSFPEVLSNLKMEIKNLIDDSGVIVKEDFKVETIEFAPKNLRSIFYNLITNAIKYRSPERQLVIKIKTIKRVNYVVLSVSDNGLGIEKEQLPNLFSMFKRVHTHVEGTGIGLYIVKRIMDNYGGKIEIMSNVDKGSTFRVFFKLNNAILK